MVKNAIKPIIRGGIYWVDLGVEIGSIQGGFRPCIVTSNNKANNNSTVVTVAPLSKRLRKMKLPTHVLITTEDVNGLPQDSFMMAEQLRPVLKDMIGDYIGCVMNDEINKAIRVSQGIDEEE